MMRTHVLLGLSVLSVLSACSNEKPQAKGPNAVDVMVMTVQPTDAPARFQFVGQTESSQQVEIRARVSGFLERRVYQEGSSVKAHCRENKPQAARCHGIIGDVNYMINITKQP